MKTLSKVIRLLFPSYILRKRLEKQYLSKSLEGNGSQSDGSYAVYLEYQIQIPGFQIEAISQNKLDKFNSSITLLELSKFVKVLIVHGSIGSGEKIAYSDLDVLVLIKNHFLKNNKKLKNLYKSLIRSQKELYRFDPLQHHGWCIMTERDLLDWPQTYLPVEVLEHACCLVPEDGIELSVRVRQEGHDYLTHFLKLCGSVQLRLARLKHPDNLYRLKSLLSEFLLLPALYVQARDQKGIFKKFSFDAARGDFSEEEWRIMDEVSRIREEWNYPVTGWRRFLLTRTHPMVRRLGIRWAPRIPESLSKQLSPDFYIRMLHLVRCMEEKLLDDPV